MKNKEEKLTKLLIKLSDAAKVDDVVLVKEIFNVNALNDGSLSPLNPRSGIYYAKVCSEANDNNANKVVNYLFPKLIEGIKAHSNLRDNLDFRRLINQIVTDKLKDDDLDFYLSFVHENEDVLSIIKNKNLGVAVKSIDSKNSGKIFKVAINDLSSFPQLLFALSFAINKKAIPHFDMIVEKLNDLSFSNTTDDSFKETITQNLIFLRLEKISKFDNQYTDYIFDELFKLIDLKDINNYIKNNKNVNDVIFDYIKPLKEKQYLSSSIKNKNPSSSAKPKKL